LWACWRRYGLVSPARRFVRRFEFIAPSLGDWTGFDHPQVQARGTPG